jgi:PrtD family type I secretion system ABC transporter
VDPLGRWDWPARVGLEPVRVHRISPGSERHQKRGQPLPRTLSSCRGAFLGVGVLSGIINLLTLAGSFYMLEVYDRVLPSRSVPTLIGLSAIILMLFAFQGFFDLVRGGLMLRIGTALDESLSGTVFRTITVLPLKGRALGNGLQPMRDLDQVRSFLSGAGPAALFDLPWMPLYLGLCFVFHVWIGVTALAGAVLLVILTLLTDVLTRKPSEMAAIAAMSRVALAEAGRRNAEAVRAMGIGTDIGSMWADLSAQYRMSQQRGSAVVGSLGSISRVLRVALQSAVLGVGAYLVIQQQATAGIIIASSILTSRALAPVDQAIANWKGFVAARQSWKRLCETMAATAEKNAPMALPAPSASLVIENASVAPPGISRVTAADVAFSLRSGQGLGIIGRSASGKSSLARMLVGVWQPVRGKIRLDGAALEHWHPEVLGRHIGYLPQDVELFAGTVAQNIARFRPDAKPDVIIAAAKAANVHDLIQYLPDGYDTQIGEQGTVLSAGQRQRIALARALYDDPFLVVLDEPNSNLDSEGEEALTKAILSVRARGGIVVVVAHRPSALAGVDRILLMADGRVQACGPKEEVLGKGREVVLPAAPASTPIHPVDLKIVRESPGGRL